MQLREYQQRSIDMLYAWFESGNTGNPCLVLPTGAGKSHIIAALCKDALQNWPETRILMLVHVKELIEQNSEKLRQHWPDAPLGIYSASIGKRQLDEPITFAGIQSVRKKAKSIGHIDLCIVDECDLISHKDEGGYRTLLNGLRDINPNMRVVGLTATPYRLGHGLITDKPAIFDALIEPVSIEELVYKGYLSKLQSKATEQTFDLTGVHKRGGEYIESELQTAVNRNDVNHKVVSEIIARAGDRKAWLVFCSGVDHAECIRNALVDRGIPAECVTGETPKRERERMIADFKAGKLRALTNANVLTVGFDHPDIDLIAMLRPTMSPRLYVQMAGRGLRVKSHTDHCLVLDFAGVVATHGPITAVKPPVKASEGNCEAPVKVCPECSELIAISGKQCPACGYVFPPPEVKPLKLHDDDIMGLSGREMQVTEWRWREHTSATSGKLMLAVSYYGALSDPVITEYLPVLHEGYAGQKAMRELMTIATQSNCVFDLSPTLASMADSLTQSIPPSTIAYRKDGKYHRVTQRSWNNAETPRAGTRANVQDMASVWTA